MENTSSGSAGPAKEKNTIDRLPSLLTVDEAARFFRINRKTLYEAIRLGQVPGTVRFGKSIRLGRDAVKAWIHSALGALPAGPR